MEKRDILPPLKRTENIFSKESIRWVIDVIKMTEGYAQSTTFDNNPHSN